MAIDLVILIPVLSRPENVEPVFTSLEENTVVPHQTVFIATEGDEEEIAALQAVGAEILIHPEPAGRGNFAKKINFGFARTEGEWLFQGADDIRFSPGWDTAALEVAARTGAQVIGTNDLHNRAVVAGVHSTHTLFSRSYIETQGGTLDNTGAVFCELYDHQFVDNEFIDLAKRRGVWAFSSGSVVEHLHPHWGNASDHPTYVKAMRKTAEDHRLYRQRARASIFALRRQTRRRVPRR